jgi:hypothetical protein
MEANLHTQLQCGGVNKIYHCRLIRLTQGSMFVRSCRQVFETFTVCLTRNRLSLLERELGDKHDPTHDKNNKALQHHYKLSLRPKYTNYNYVTRPPEESYSSLSIRIITVILHFDNGEYGRGYCRYCQSSQTRALLQRHSPVGLVSYIFSL